MRLSSLTIARNEEWVIRASLTGMLRWCDDAVVLLHASTDGTRDAVEQVSRDHPGRVHILTEEDPVWREMAHRQRTLAKAREIGATHMALVDADEFLTNNLTLFVKDMIQDLPSGGVLQLPWLQCWRSFDRYRDDDSSVTSQFASMAFRDAPQLCWRATNGYDFHHREPHEAVRPFTKPWQEKAVGGFLHLQHAEWPRVAWKHCLYRITELLRWPQFGVPAINARYAGSTDEKGLGLTTFPPDWWGPERSMVIENQEPWQKAEVIRLIETHGREKFAGLDFLGLL